MIRLLSVELHDFKNVEYGIVNLSDMPQEEDRRVKSSVTGVYGQNGSGKTSLIDALHILRTLWLGQALDEKTADCIAKDKEELTIRCKFYIEGLLTENLESDSVTRLVAHYMVAIARDNDSAKVRSEILSLKNLTSGESMRQYFHFEQGDKIPRPRSLWTSLFPANSEARLDFAVAEALSREDGRSVLFSQKFVQLLNRRARDLLGLCAERDDSALLQRIRRAHLINVVILSCVQFALNDFVVIPLSYHALTSLGLLTVTTHESLAMSRGGAPFQLSLLTPQTVKPEEYEEIVETMGTINKPLGALVPGLSIEVRRIGEEMRDDGDIGLRIEMLSRRDGVLIPFRCESEGIKKIVAVLIALVDAFSNPSACIAIDEFDAGVFEFLLGEILEVIESHGKGQLIFTAHNLIPLEVLSDKSIVFTTANPENRYITFKGHRPTNNLRDQYLRAVSLGGQSEEIYEKTSKYKIDSAFHRAGKSLRNVRGLRTEIEEAR